MYLSPVDLSFRTLHPSTFFSTPTEFTHRQGNRHHHRSRLQQCHYCSPTLHVSATLLTVSASIALNDHVKPRLRLPMYPPIVPYAHTQRRKIRHGPRVRAHVNPEPGASRYEAEALC